MVSKHYLRFGKSLPIPAFALFFLVGFLGVEMPFSVYAEESPLDEHRFIDSGNPRYIIHDLNQFGAGYRAIQLDSDPFGRLLLVSGGSVWSFDGSLWKAHIDHHDSPKPIVGVAIGKEGEQYVGLNGDWGILRHSTEGTHILESLKNYNDPVQKRVLEDLYQVEVLDNGVGFLSNYSYVHMDINRNIDAYVDLYRLTTQFCLNGKTYLCSERESLMLLDSGNIQDLSHLLPEGELIAASCEWIDGRYLLGSSNARLYLFDGASIVEFETDAEQIGNFRVNDLELINDRYIAITLDGWGLCIVDIEGNLVHSIGKHTDPRFINAATLFYNEDGSLWVSVAAGLAQIFFPSPISMFDHNQGIVMSWPSVYRYQGKLYLRSNRMIFEGVYDNNGVLDKFEMAGIPENNSRVDALLPVEEGILFSEKSGIYIWKQGGDIAAVAEGLVSHFIYHDPHQSDVIYSVNDEGVYVLLRKNGQWKWEGDFLAAPGAHNQVCYEDAEGYFWTERGIASVVRFRYSHDHGLVGRAFTSEDGLENTWVSMYEIDNTIYISNMGNHQRYDYDSGQFIGDARMQKIAEDLDFRVIRPYGLQNGEMLLPTTDGIVFLKRNNEGELEYDFSTFAVLSEYNPMILDTIPGEIWMRTQSSLLRYDKEHEQLVDPQVRTFIESIEVAGTKEVLHSILLRDSFDDGSSMHIKYRREGLRFEFFTPSFNRIQPLRHRYFLEGFSTEWSDLAEINEAVFIGIPEGNYTFIVEAVDHQGNVGQQTQLKFVVDPPWFRTPIAYITYLITFGILFLVVVYANRRSVILENQRLERLVGERTQRLEKVVREAQEATQAKSQFLANMSHEIRTPINGIIGSSDMLIERELKPEQKELMKIIQSSANNLKGLVDGILDFSLIEANKIVLHQQSISIDQVIRECMDVVSMISQNKRIELFYHLDSLADCVYVGDEDRIKQIIINFLGNALKFTSVGYVALYCKDIGEQDGKRILEFTVIDTGIGIETDEFDDLLKPFNQGDNSNTRIFGGAGLGLSICRELIQLMGGKIEAHKRESGGTRMVFTICLEPVEASLRKTEVSAHSEPPGKSNHILLIDRFEERRNCLSRYLRQFGFETRVCSMDEASRFSCGEVEHYDFVIIDDEETVVFTELLNSLEQLKQRHKLEEVLILSYPDIRFSDSLISSVVTKPFSFADLLPRLKYRQYEDESQSEEILEEVMHLDRIADQEIRYLIVEDNQVNQRVVDLMLKKKHINAVHAWNGREAVELSNRQSFDIILMDIQMPEMDGLEATREIKSIHKDTIIIGLSANARDADKQVALQVGMDDFLTKPVKKKMLESALQSAVETLRLKNTY